MSVNNKIGFLTENKDTKQVNQLSKFTEAQSKQTKRQRSINLLKIVALTGFPMMAFVVLAIGSLTEAHWGVEHADEMQAVADDIDHIRDVIFALQSERAATCLYLVVNRSSFDISSYDEYHQKTDLVLSNEYNSAERSKDKQMLGDLFKRIQQHRQNSPNNCSDALMFFDAEIALLIGHINWLSRHNKDGHFWIDLFARNLLWHVKENIGVKQAIGSAFLATGELSIKNRKTYTEATSMANSLLRIALSKVPKLGTQWVKLIENEKGLFVKIEEMDTLIIGFNNENIKNQNGAFQWFSTIKRYLDLIRVLEEDLTAELANDVGSQRMEHSNHFWIVLCGILASVVFCFTITLIHGFQSHTLTVKVREFTIQMSDENTKIEHEKRKTEQLLVQMLPVSVAMKLLAGENILPETYTECTVFFSDVKGFTELCGQSTPLQVVTLLNELYVTFDKILDSYDCYKVETIGDAYMVVSGIPERNGHQHSSEICTMALDIMKSSSSFAIPHMPEKILNLRIGLHTGPCASGVVGVKMPRFCLFGDTVNVASRMESTGIAGRIQISGDTRGHLVFRHGNFQFVLRTEINVKGKGKLKTYWLVGKEGFNFRINIPVNDEF